MAAMVKERSRHAFGINLTISPPVYKELTLLPGIYRHLIS
jgi:hypothetical protein